MSDFPVAVGYESNARVADLIPTAWEARRMLHALAEVSGDLMVQSVRSFTPIGSPHPFDSRLADYFPGHLWRSITKRPVRETVDLTGARVYESGAETDVSYAPDVEHGTGVWGEHGAPYVIRPKRPGGFLMWHDRQTGERVFAREVHHPGVRGHHMFARGAALAETLYPAVAEPIVIAWSHEVELRIDSRTGPLLAVGQIRALAR